MLPSRLWLAACASARVPLTRALAAAAPQSWRPPMAAAPPLPPSSSFSSSSSAFAAAPAPAPARTGVTLVGVEPARGAGARRPPSLVPREACGDPVADAAAAAAAAGAGEDDEESDGEERVPMVDPATGEWNGPTRGDSRPEPTRFGDWATKGRVTDF